MEKFLAMAKKGSVKSPEELEQILDLLPVPVSWASLESGEIQFMNRAFKRTFGYCETDFLDVADWIEQTYVLADDRKRATEMWRDFWMPQGQGLREVESVEFEIRCADGRTIIASHRGIILSDYGIGVATFEDITEQKIAERALREIVLQDPLTQLGNRRALMERWELEMPRGPDRAKLAAVLMVDLDHFKPVNDSLGHEAGDAVLRMVAKRLKRSVRDTDLVVRMGGDEFVILLTNLSDQGAAERVCRRIEKTFREPFNINDTQVTLGVSVGASLYPRDGGELSVLLQKADEALYDIKRNGKGGWNWCSNLEATDCSFVI